MVEHADDITANRRSGANDSSRGISAGGQQYVAYFEDGADGALENTSETKVSQSELSKWICALTSFALCSNSSCLWEARCTSGSAWELPSRRIPFYW